MTLKQWRNNKNRKMYYDQISDKYIIDIPYLTEKETFPNDVEYVIHRFISDLFD